MRRREDGEEDSGVLKEGHDGPFVVPVPDVTQSTDWEARSEVQCNNAWEVTCVLQLTSFTPSSYSVYIFLILFCFRLRVRVMCIPISPPPNIPGRLCIHSGAFFPPKPFQFCS